MKNEQHRELMKSFIDVLDLPEYNVVESTIQNWAVTTPISDDFGIVEHRYMYSDFEIKIVGTSYRVKSEDEYPLEDCVL
jgi:Holliday junction resolvasome RuvABC ATP-dependent DNA helicase subunit